MPSTRKVEFQLPDGVAPDGVTAGEEFDAVCTFRVKGNGYACLVMLGDVEMPGYRDKAEKAPNYRDEADEMVKARG